MTTQGAFFIIRKIPTASLLTAFLATVPTSSGRRIWCRVTSVTETVNRKFLTWMDNCGTYSSRWFVGRSLTRGLLIARSRASWYCVISLLGGLTPVGSGANSRYVSWLLLNVIPLCCIPFPRSSFLAWPPGLGVRLGRCPSPCWWLLVNIWWQWVGILPVAMTRREIY